MERGCEFGDAPAGKEALSRGAIVVGRHTDLERKSATRGPGDDIYRESIRGTSAAIWQAAAAGGFGCALQRSPTSPAKPFPPVWGSAVSRGTPAPCLTSPATFLPELAPAPGR